MARLLSTHESASSCLNIVRRHERLIRQVANNNSLLEPIKKVRENLEIKLKVKNDKQAQRENAYDDLILSDRNLDDSARTIFEKCEQYDREHPSEIILKKVFTDEKYGVIVRLPFAKEVIELDKIVVRLESLGSGHALFPLAAELKTRINITKEGIKANDAAIVDVKMAEADVEIAKEGLIRQYEANYLEARKMYGKNNCEKLFPRMQTRSETDEEPEEVAAETDTQQI
jgi:hypothetical protein